MDLSIEQKKAIDHLYGPALVLAVPGAGKTTVLIHRVANLIKNHGASPERILSITFSRASARDMKARFDSYFPNISDIPTNFSTIHSFCFNLIRDYAYTKNLKYTLIEEEKNNLNKFALLKNLYLQANKEYITEEKLESLINSIGYIKNMMLDVDSFLLASKVDIDSFKEIYINYENYKKKNNLIDFDDMLTLSYQILLENPSLLDKYRGKYDFIQVDEGQDTSKIQLEIIKLLASPKDNLFIVADDDQSIYGFRGAFPKGLLNFNKSYKDGKVFFMEENYRSSKNIVTVCNNFIKSNNLRYNKNIFTRNEFLEPINIIKVNTIVDQYDYLIKEIKDQDLSKICILYRNNLSSVGIVEMLERNNMPFYVKDTKQRFFNHWLVNDIFNFIRFSKDPYNIDLFESIYYKMKGYISKKQVLFAKGLSYNISVLDRILEFPEINGFYKRNLGDLKFDFKKLSSLSPSRAIDYIENQLEYGEYLRENSSKFGYTFDGVKTILYYLKLIAEKTKTFEELEKRLSYLKGLSSNYKHKGSALTLSTVHSAKGLEFDRVYMIDLIDGDFPSSSSLEASLKGNLELFEEERRLFYVGMTRAKYHLSLLTVNTIGDKTYDASRFLSELRE